MNIESLGEFIEWASQFNDGQYLFRGVPDQSYEIQASAYRRLPEEEIDNPARLLRINKRLIEEAKTQGHDQKNGQRLSDLELLAELQHYGAATCLIDFSRNALTALWFACQQDSAEKETNGKVFAVPDIVSLKEVTPDLIAERIDYFFKPDGQGQYPLYKWKPKLQNNRIIAQHSVFVFGGDQIRAETECVIILNSKEAILKSLAEISDITEASIFPDFDGFARLHAHNKPYIEPDARDYLQRGITAYQGKKLDDSIAYYTKAIELDPRNVSIAAPAYYNRGLVYYDKKEVELAIADYTRAIELNPNFDAAYFTRGLTYYNRKEVELAIADYTRVIEINPNPAYAYNNRGVAYIGQGNIGHAIHDYTRAIELNPDYALAHYNRGVALLYLREWEKTKSDLTTAKEKGLNIINAFRNDYESVAAFEDKYSIQIPEDITEMLTST